MHKGYGIAQMQCPTHVRVECKVTHGEYSWALVNSMLYSRVPSRVLLECNVSLASIAAHKRPNAYSLCNYYIKLPDSQVDSNII